MLDNFIKFHFILILILNNLNFLNMNSISEINNIYFLNTLVTILKKFNKKTGQI